MWPADGRRSRDWKAYYARGERNGVPALQSDAIGAEVSSRRNARHCTHTHTHRKRPLTKRKTKQRDGAWKDTHDTYSETHRKESTLRINKATGELEVKVSSPQMPIYEFVDIYKRLFRNIKRKGGFARLPDDDYFKLLLPEVLERLDARAVRRPKQLDQGRNVVTLQGGL